MTMKNITDKMFRRVAGLAWDMTSGKVGIKTPNGIYTLSATTAPAAEGETPVTTYSINVNPFESFGAALPAFALRTNQDEVELGDLLVGETKIIGWVVEKTPAAYRVLDLNGFNKLYSPPKVQVLNSDKGSVLVVRDMTKLVSGDNKQGFASNMIAMLALGRGDSEIGSILPALLMGGMGAGGNGGLNPAVQMMLTLEMTKAMGAGGSGGSTNPLMLAMMMGGGMGGLGGATQNPFGMLLMLKAMRGGDAGLEKMLPLLAVTSGGGDLASNPMLMAALLGDGDLFGGLAGFDDDQVTGQPAPIPAPLLPQRPALRRS